MKLHGNVKSQKQLSSFILDWQVKEYLFKYIFFFPLQFVKKHIGYSRFEVLKLN